MRLRRGGFRLFAVVAAAASSSAIAAGFDCARATTPAERTICASPREGGTLEGRIFPDPRHPHPGFKPHELAFATPRDGVARAEFRSVPFYAIILNSAPRCSVKESERHEVQALFPGNKVFFPRVGCEDAAEENIAYTNVDARLAFLAVYAGATQAEAKELLGTVSHTGRFPGANVRRMQAILIYP